MKSKLSNSLRPLALILALVVAAPLAHAQTRIPISSLPVATSMGASDLVPIDVFGVSYTTKAITGLLFADSLLYANGPFAVVMTNLNGKIAINNFSGVSATDFSLGALNLYQIKGVNYGWPSGQGAANSVLTDDGAGNLSWGTSPTFINLNITSNFFQVAKGGKLIITNSLVLSYDQPNTILYTDSNTNVVGLANASGVLTNDGSGNFGWSTALPNSDLANSSVTINGTANQVSVSGGAPLALGGTATLSLPSPTIAPGAISANGVTNSALTTAGVVTNDANGKLYSVPTLQNALLANSSVTVNGTANHITTTSASIPLGGSATLDVGSSVALVDANNAWGSTSSNFVNNAVTTWATNSNNTTPDFAIPLSLLSTNNSFTWLSAVHKDTSGKAYQLIEIDVTNSSGSAITMTLPGGFHQCNGGVGLVVTNWSKCFVEYYPPSGPTNFWHCPGY